MRVRGGGGGEGGRQTSTSRTWCQRLQLRHQVHPLNQSTSIDSFLCCLYSVTYVYFTWLDSSQLFSDKDLWQNFVLDVSACYIFQHLYLYLWNEISLLRNFISLSGMWAASHDVKQHEVPACMYSTTVHATLHPACLFNVEVNQYETKEHELDQVPFCTISWGPIYVWSKMKFMGITTHKEPPIKFGWARTEPNGTYK